MQKIITIKYPIKADDLIIPAFIFLRTKPFMRLILITLKTICWLIVLLFGLKLLTTNFNLEKCVQEFAGFSLASFILLFEKKITFKILAKHLSSLVFIDKDFEVSVSDNGIIWEGNLQKPGSVSFSEIKYYIDYKDGFIIPAATNRFLWLPKVNFIQEQHIDMLRKLFAKYRIKKILA